VQVQYATDRPELPESALIVPVLFDEQVLGVLVVQSYEPNAFDEDDLSLVEGFATLAAVPIAVGDDRFAAPGESAGRFSDIQLILSSMADGLLVLDEDARLVRLNQAARELLCPGDTSLIVGHPIDRPQAGRWPLGTEELTQQISPIVDGLRQHDVPAEELEINLDGAAPRRIGCRASVLEKNGQPVGGVLVLREINDRQSTSTR
jgi:PAS domain-containing protein